ncbi:DinB family protein [Solitalea koreensis]|uniref:Uncharacterized damage-inducible protein DinB (Forms a four-helix bundle) n=1 Tax=Solitalea koreensis TaxID=543615 RepID=A0A521CBL7_9SPHI|nr:DinB family protein [Solitalea koreensis]SMO56150.1 Uncharacterized damage-inducible protein DinB (forms a four-helix bundle) [Solitalea koreensis]
MYRSVEDFVADWKYEIDATETLLRELTDKSLSRKVYRKGRTLGYLAWHLAIAIVDMLTQAGLNVEGPALDAEAPETADEIRIAYAAASSSALRMISKKWLDSELDTEITIYGESWKRGKLLSVLILHQVHHRGQMTVLMRQAGLKVTGIYGPAKEEWSSMGMLPMK